jgi:hypothetical protein
MAACPDLAYVTSLCALPLGKETIPVSINEIVFYTEKASGDKKFVVYSIACSILALPAPTMTDVRVGLGYKPVAVPLEPVANYNVAMHSTSLISSSEIPRTQSGGLQRIKQEGLRRTMSDTEFEPASPGSAYSIDTVSLAASSTSSSTSNSVIDRNSVAWHWSDTAALDSTPAGTGI